MPPGPQRRKPTRRFHRKSRTGCKECRARRIKCDETHPSCENCQRASMACHYAAQSQNRSQSRSSGEETALLLTNGATQITSSIVTNCATPEPSFDMLDLNLMHHYTAVTSISLFGEEQRELWQVEVPVMARSSPLLIHGLLATSALHMTFLHKEDSSLYTTRALHHHGIGLRLFNENITTLSSEASNSHVLFTFGIFLVIWAYASPNLTSTPTAPDSDSTGSDLDTLLSSLELVRGNKVIFELSSETILSKPIGRFTEPSHKPRTRIHNLPPNLDETLTHLRKTATDFIDHTAIDHLERFLLDTVSTSACDMRKPLGWPALIEAPFWERVKRHKPSALLILMHYAIISGYYELRAWWIEGWSEKLVAAVQRALPVEELRERYAWGVCMGHVLGIIMKMKEGRW
ncbi:hypothetical protein BJX61DRAFT_92765 [Aspergillus egyptiacus]|nr:hypothetical protein BJX61DRAFT_92765 [Aspergillus egyptiacus]